MILTLTLMFCGKCECSFQEVPDFSLRFGSLGTAIASWRCAALTVEVLMRRSRIFEKASENVNIFDFRECQITFLSAYLSGVFGLNLVFMWHVVQMLDFSFQSKAMIETELKLLKLLILQTAACFNYLVISFNFFNQFLLQAVLKLRFCPSQAQAGLLGVALSCWLFWHCSYLGWLSSFLKWHHSSHSSHSSHSA